MNQVREMQLHCENGLLKYNGIYLLQQSGTSENDSRSIENLIPFAKNVSFVFILRFSLNSLKAFSFLCMCAQIV